MNFKLAVISISDVIINRDCEQLRSLIGDIVDVKGYTFAQIKENPSLEEPLALIIGPELVSEQILAYLPPDIKCIFNRRSLDPITLPLLYQIPADSEVLVVNDCFINACELTEELKELNIHSLKYFPYNPLDPSDPYRLNSSYSALLSYNYSQTINEQWGNEAKPSYNNLVYSGRPFQYAITAGEAHEVPRGIPNVIDLGQRQINIMTIADILQFFKGSASYDTLVSSRYMKKFIHLSMELAKQNNRNQFLQTQLESVIGNFENGILLINEEYSVLLYNRMAEEILGENDLKSRNLKDFLPLPKLIETNGSEFIQINSDMVYITKTEIRSPQDERCYLISLKSWDQLQNIDQQYRKQKKYSEHIAKYHFGDILYKSSVMADIIAKAKVFAKYQSSVLITGESGTGKELFAQSIHNASPRKNAPFIAINCGALSETLLESELFGYEEGAFTGAKKGGKKGLFELAHTGTLFLDEIGDTPPTTQTKLLRALQEKEILRVGGSHIIPVDVRIITATNQDLYNLVEKGLFRKDLYYRLRTLPLTIPPLRQRPEDIQVLFDYLLRTVSARHELPLFPEVLWPIIKNHTWPGNIRELRNMVEYLISICEISSDIVKDTKIFLELEEEATSAEGRYGMKVGVLPSKPFQYPDENIQEQCIFILKLLAEAKDHHAAFIGRTRLQEKLASQYGVHLTFEQIKGRQRLLAKYGLIVPINGKGYYISAFGENYLSQG